jgi:hypothetical protein
MTKVAVKPGWIWVRVIVRDSVLGLVDRMRRTSGALSVRVTASCPRSSMYDCGVTPRAGGAIPPMSVTATKAMTTAGATRLRIG